LRSVTIVTVSMENHLVCKKDGILTADQ